MPAVTITPSDLAPFADIPEPRAQAMIDDALAWAADVAPCILEDDFTKAAKAKAVIRGAILRWNDAGSGARKQRTQAAGQMSTSEVIDTTVQRRSMFWPSEIVELQKLCGAQRSGRAFTVDTTPPLPITDPLEGAVINLPEVDE